jgi:predicted lipoprotein with Yx(FWY)xxD motif
MAGPALAAAGPTMSHSSKSAVVVKARTRHHFGKILVTPKGMALYYMPHGSCTAGCLSIWPRLVLPKGKTMPKGAKCLGTAKFGSHHRLQVTYHGKRLYTFVEDSGTSVNGNGEAGFKVAKVVRCS